MTNSQTCRFFVARKSRLCKLAPMPGSEYCGEHQPGDRITERGARVPCPLDPLHSVFEADMCSHLKVCNSRPRESDYETANANIVDPRAAEEPARPLVELSNWDAVVDTVNKVEPVVQGFLSTFAPHEPAIDRENSRNDAQVIRISSQVDAASIGDYTLIEVGAGKAKLSHQFVLMNSSNMPKRTFLVDRSKVRCKMDRKIESLAGHAERVHCDLKNLDFTKIPLHTPSVVVIAKHACGEATCYALIALGKAISVHPEKSFFLSVAPCCHQSCRYETFCNQSMLKSLHIGHSEFHFITRLSSWAVCAPASDDVIGRHKKSQIGALMKWFVDICRLRYVESLGLSASLRLYCHQSHSPENRVIVARPAQPAVYNSST